MTKGHAAALYGLVQAVLPASDWNSGSLTRFLHEVGPRWRKWLNRRNRIRSMTWEKFCGILRRYPLAPVRTVRSTFRHAANP